MFKTQKFYWWAQFGGWTAFMGLSTMLRYTREPDSMTELFYLNAALVVLIGVSVTHIQRLLFIQQGWLNIRLNRLLPRVIVLSILCSVVIWGLDFVTDYISGYYQEELVLMRKKNPEMAGLTFPKAIAQMLVILLLVFSWNGIYFTFHFFQKSRKQEVSNLELVASNKESELKNLRSQLNPHFLFNSLNSIRALVDIDPLKAKKSITTLSNLLRQSLDLGKENLVSLERELNVSKSYLDLERVRFEERLQVEWEIDSALEEFQVPPFSLQMMVENAIKHGISNLKEGGVVRIRAYEKEDQICIQVINSGNLNQVVDLGVGIQNIRKRLELQYGNNASFFLREQPGNNVEALMCFKNERI